MSTYYWPTSKNNSTPSTNYDGNITLAEAIYDHPNDFSWIVPNIIKQEVTKEVSVEVPVSVEVTKEVSVEVISDTEQMKLNMLSNIIDQLSNIVWYTENPQPISVAQPIAIIYG